MTKNFYTYVKAHYGKILVRDVLNGKRRIFTDTSFEPEAYIETDEENTGWATIDGQSVDRYIFDDIKTLSKYINQNRKKINIYTAPHHENQYVVENYGDYYDIDKLSIWTLDIETKAEYGFPDVETGNEDIILITVRNKITKQTITWGYKPYTGLMAINYILCKNEDDMLRQFLSWWSKIKPDIVTGWNVEYFDMPYLIHRTHALFGKGDLRDPENEFFKPVRGFMVKQLSPFGVIKRKRNKEDDPLRAGDFSYDIYGVSTLDYMKLYKKYVPRKKESYKLDYIAEIELGKRKNPNNYGTFREFYTNDWNAFVEYNVQDVLLVDEMEKKKNFIPVHAAFAYMGGVNFEDAFHQTRTWDGIIYKYFKENGLVVPIREHREKEEKFKGAYVKKTLLGLHKWIVSLDLRSVYPMSIIQFNLSPETATHEFVKCTMDDLVNKNFDTADIHERNLCLAGNRYLYRKDKKGFMAIIMQKLFDERTKHKNLMLEAKQALELDPGNAELIKKRDTESVHQEALKTSLVSAYGTVGSPFFRFYDRSIAESVTQSTQYIIRLCEKRINELMNKEMGTTGEDYIIAMDTDSAYISMEKLVEKYVPDGTTEEKINFMNVACEKVLQPFLNDIMKEISEYTNSMEMKMDMKREALIDAGLWIAKKKYFIRVHDNEGVKYAEPKIEYKGVEAVRSDTPGIVRDLLTDSFHIILNKDEDEFNRLVADFEREYKKKPPEELAMPTSIKDFEQYCRYESGPDKGKIAYNRRGDMMIVVKGASMHGKASIHYNNIIRRLNLEHKYELIKSGDRIKYVFLRMPNSIGVDVVAFNSVLPEEFNVHHMVDHKRHFNRSFVNPMERIIKSLNWGTSQNRSLFKKRNKT